METTVLVINSGNDVFYFDQQPDNTIRLFKHEKYINTYNSLGDAFQAYYIRSEAICLTLNLARIETADIDRTYILDRT